MVEMLYSLLWLPNTINDKVEVFLLDQPHLWRKVLRTAPWTYTRGLVRHSKMLKTIFRKVHSVQWITSCFMRTSNSFLFEILFALSRCPKLCRRSFVAPPISPSFLQSVSGRVAKKLKSNGWDRGIKETMWHRHGSKLRRLMSGSRPVTSPGDK